MATFSTWAAVRTAIKDALATAVGGAVMMGEYRVGDTTVRYRTFEELKKLYEMTYQFESLDSIDTCTRVSYGRHRRFR